MWFHKSVIEEKMFSHQLTSSLRLEMRHDMMIFFLRAFKSHALLQSKSSNLTIFTVIETQFARVATSQCLLPDNCFRYKHTVGSRPRP